MSVRRAAILLGVAMAAATGAYTIIYLYRWEWHRAIIAGIFFVAVELGLIGAAILLRLRRIEIELTTGATLDEQDRVKQRLAEAAPRASRRFDWLKDSSDQLNVFLPVLLGAGMLLSAVAWVVEMLGRVTAMPLVDRSLAARLEPIAFPRGGLLADRPPPVTSRPTLLRRAAGAGALVLGLVLAALAVDVVADATQNRPDPPPRDVTTLLDLRFSGARPLADPIGYAERLWTTCSHIANVDMEPLAVSDLGEGRVLIHLPGDVGENGRRRIRGCVEDAVLDHLQAGLVAFRELPASE